MNRIAPLYTTTVALAILSVFALFACGGEAHEDPAPVELGQLEQHLYMDLGYGADDAMNRCSAPSWVGTCSVPSSKYLEFDIPTSTTTHGCDSLFRGGIQTGLLQLAGLVVSNGGNWVSSWWPADQTTISNQPDYSVWCYASGGGDTGGAETFVTGNFVLTDQCWDTQYGELCTRSAGWTIIYPSVIAQKWTKWSQATVQQKTRLIRNIMRHEFAHYMGLGHATPSNSVLMAAAPTTSWDWFDNEKNPNAYELDRLRRFNPSGSSPY